MTNDTMNLESADDIALADRMKNGREQILAELHKRIVGQADIIELVELRGASSVSTPAPQQLQQMAATDINLAYQPDGKTLRQVTLAERATVQFRAEGPGPGRRLSAALIDMQLDADGSTMTGLTAQESAQLTVPQAGATPARQAVMRTGLGT